MTDPRAHTRPNAIRINKLSPFNPILQRLPKKWRDDNPPVTAPPLPTHRKHTPRKKKAPKSTRLCNLAKQSDPLDEQIDPLYLPPWQQTPADFDYRITIIPPIKGIKKEDEADHHKKKVRDLERDPSNLLVYTDGSLLEKDGARRVGAGLVGYYLGKPVFKHQIGGWEGNQKYMMLRSQPLTGEYEMLNTSLTQQTYPSATFTSSQTTPQPSHQSSYPSHAQANHTPSSSTNSPSGSSTNTQKTLSKSPGHRDTKASKATKGPTYLQKMPRPSAAPNTPPEHML